MILPDSRNCDCRTGENAELESRERRGTSSWDKLNNLELAVNLPKRGNLPGAENLVAQHFLELFAQSKNNEVAELAVESPQGILCTPDTVDKFQVSTKSASVKTVLHTVATTIVGPSATVMTAIVCPSDTVAVVMMYKRGKGSVTFGCLFYMLGSPGRGSGQPRKEEREMQALLLVVRSLPFISATTVLEGQSDVLEQYLKDSRTTVSRL